MDNLQKAWQEIETEKREKTKKYLAMTEVEASKLSPVEYYDWMIAQREKMAEEFVKRRQAQVSKPLERAHSKHWTDKFNE